MDTKLTAVVFPGQGTQRPGMGKDFFDSFPESRSVYEHASDALGWDVAAICFDDDPRLNLTEYAQPCILTTEIAMFKGVVGNYGFNADYFGGHSLGEYTALVAASAMPLEDAVRIVHTRGRLMQEASPPGVGGMAAVICDDLDINDLKDALRDLPLDIANINSSDQVVISGKSDSMANAEQQIKKTFTDKPDLRFVPLNVSAPFHSRFMSTIQESFTKVLKQTSQALRPEKSVRVTSNFKGEFYSDTPGELIDSLVSQLSAPVKWRDNMEHLASKATDIVEIGPGRPLRQFFSKAGVACKSVTSLKSAQRVLEN